MKEGVEQVASPTTNEKKSQTARIIIFALGIAGMMLSGYLWFLHFDAASIKCSVSSCTDVLTGEHSLMFGIPVAVFGFGFYALVTLLAYLRIEAPHKKIDQLFTLTLGAGALYTIYLRYVEFAKIGGWCEWCWGSVLIMVLLIGTYWYERKSK